MAVTAKDIALELGLSQSTVSRILNGDVRQRISQQTRERVLQVAQRLEYQPNALARSLRSGRTNVIGLYTNQTYDARNDFLAEILGGMQQGCIANGLDLLLHIGTQNRPDEEIYQAVRDGRIDGLIVHISPLHPLVRRLAATELPVIALADPDPELCTVSCDDAGGMRLLVKYFTARGYEHYVYIEPQFQLASVVRRRESWRANLLACGVHEDQLTTLKVPAEDAESAVETLKVLAPRRTAVSCWNDRTAYSFLRSSRVTGGERFAEFGVTGFDGLIDEKLPSRRLVTIDCHWADAARTAVDLLMKKISGEDVPAETCLPVSLLEGDTA